jgi:hypothetical protein
VTEARERRLERSESARGFPVSGRVRSEDALWLAQASASRSDVDVVQDVAENENPVGLAPEGNVTGRVPGHVEYPKPCDVVPFLEPASDRMRWAGPGPLDQPVYEMTGLLEVTAFHRSGVVAPTPEGDPKLLADLLARALVIGMRMGEGVRPDRVTPQLTEDAPARMTRCGVHDNVTDQVDVDRVRRKSSKLVDVVCEPLDRAILNARRLNNWSARSRSPPS